MEKYLIKLEKDSTDKNIISIEKNSVKKSIGNAKGERIMGFFHNSNFKNDIISDFQGYCVKLQNYSLNQSIGMYIENGCFCCEEVGGFLYTPKDLKKPNIQLNNFLKKNICIIDNIYWKSDSVDINDVSRSSIVINTNLGDFEIGVYNTNSYYKHDVYTHFNGLSNIHTL